MKNKSIILKTSIGVALILIIQSCTLTKKGEFAQQKYTKFHKGGTEIVLNKATSEPIILSKENLKFPVVSNDRIVFNEEKQIITSANTQVSIDPVKKVYKPIFKKVAESKFVKRGMLKMTKRIKASFASTKNTASCSDDQTILLVILAILIPPLAVALKVGLSTPFWLDLLLTLLFYFPGMIYALIVVLG